MLFWSRPLVLGLLVGCISPALGAASSPPGPIRVLIVDGYSNHDWRHTTALIRQVLLPTGLFSVDVSTAPPTAQAPGWDQWRPRFADYAAVIQTCNDYGGGPSWPTPVRADFERYVAHGGGVFIFHSGNNAFPDWPEYNRIIGLGWRKRHYGWALTLDNAGGITRIPPGTGENTGHGARVNRMVTQVGEHPIHAGMPRRWISANLEVYYYVRGPAENLQVLAFGFDPKTAMNWPVEWTVQYGQGRVYNSTFGHVWKDEPEPPGMRGADVQTLLIRGLQWVAKRPVDFPVPPDFPTADHVSLRSLAPP